MSGQRLFAVAVLFFLSLAFLILDCAEVSPPPGGEEDKLPPTIIETSPANGAINVPPGNEITFWFSEGIIKPATARPIFISPRQTLPPELHWKSDRLTVKLAENLETNQTYVLTLTSEISDWRRNKMDSTVTIAFSTGESIDSGSVNGFMTSAGERKGGVLVGLYEASSPNSEIIFDSIYPSYLTQSAKDGSFRFRFLPETKFVMVAFEDINRNERYNPLEEPFAVSDREISLGSLKHMDGLYLELSAPAAKQPEIVSALFTADRLIRIRLNTNIQLDYLKNYPMNIKFSTKSDSSRIHEAQAFLESHLDTSSVLTVFANSLDTGAFIIAIQYDSTVDPITYDGVTIGELKDKNRPVIVEFLPPDRSQFKKDLKITALFSEPIDKSRLTAGTFSLANGDSQVVNVIANWNDAFHLSVETDTLAEGGRYTMSMAEFEIVDLAGNIMGDSIKSFSFSVLSSDSLGSISGTLLMELPKKDKSTKQLSFTDLKSRQSFELKVTGNSFTTELPSGKYLMSGFLDENNNSRRDLGSVRPYTFAETFSQSTDTISVRARFETAGIEFKFK